MTSEVDLTATSHLRLDLRRLLRLEVDLTDFSQKINSNSDLTFFFDSEVVFSKV